MKILVPVQFVPYGNDNHWEQVEHAIDEANRIERETGESVRVQYALREDGVHGILILVAQVKEV